jgi:hypothetical protein
MKKTIRGNYKANRSITITLNQGYNALGIEDSIKGYVDSEVLKNIPSVKDMELIRYRPLTNGFTIHPKFGTTLSSDFTAAGFTASESKEAKMVLGNSVFILQAYSTYDSDTQTLLSTTYVKAEDEATNTLTGEVREASLKFNNTKIIKDFNNIYIPYNYSGDKVYVRLFFFNAKTGVLSYFKYADVSDDSGLYYSVTLDRANKTYSFDAIGTTLNLREYKPSSRDKRKKEESGKILSVIKLKLGKLSDVLLNTVFATTVQGGEESDYGNTDEETGITGISLSTDIIYDTKFLGIYWEIDNKMRSVNIYLESPNGEFPTVPIATNVTGDTYSFKFLKEQAGMTSPSATNRIGRIRVEETTDSTSFKTINVVMSSVARDPLSWNANGMVFYGSSMRPGYSYSISYSINNPQVGDMVDIMLEYDSVSGSRVSIKVGQSETKLASYTYNYYANVLNNADWVGGKVMGRIYFRDPLFPSTVWKGFNDIFLYDA